jgi:UDP-glucose 4-epimerase
MRILITGCGGFIGGALGRFAAAAGHTVMGVARRTQPDRNWPGEYVAIDVAHADLSGIVADFKPDMIFHAAGSSSVAGSIAAPLEDLRAALMTWANLLDSVRRSGLRPLVMFPSSAAVYGNPTTLPVREDAPVAPISPYGFHKAACELLAREYADCFGFRIVVCRIFSVFGPTQRRLLIYELAEQALGPNPEVWLQGTGEETRDYLHVDDLTAAVLHLATGQLAAREPRALWFVNLASGVETKAADIARELCRQVAPEKQVRCRGLARPGDPWRWRADVSLLHSLTKGWGSGKFSEVLARCVPEWSAGP